MVRPSRSGKRRLRRIVGGVLGRLVLLACCVLMASLVWAARWEAPDLCTAFQVAPQGKADLVVHEWGVFTVFNDAKYANANRKEEWGSMPSFFYRQFPTERLRLRWLPSAWDKPIVYFYAKAPLKVSVKVSFPEGAPVVWWPAAVDPVDDSPGGNFAKRARPIRTLTWDAWLGD